MKWLYGILAAILLVTGANAQSGSSVRQSGNITPNHATSWTTNGVVQDGGAAADSPITSFGVTSNTTAGICVSSGRATAAGRQQLCLGAPLSSNAIISLQNYGTATAQGLDFVINGVTASIPSTGGDFITGTGPYASGGIPCFTGTTSTVTDCGLVSVPHGGTGASTTSAARTNLGLGTMATQDAGAVAITGGTITGMPSPSVGTDVANKSYVDATSTGLTILAPSGLATAAVLPNTPTYANGTLGVGATLTAGSNTTLTVDGTVATINTVVLVKNQAAPAENGIYTVTTAGGGVPWVLTRATYFDQAAEMKAGSYTFISAGSVNANTSYTLQTAVTTVGTDPVTFVQFSGGTGGVSSIAGLTGAFTLANGIDNSGQQIQLTAARRTLPTFQTLTSGTGATYTTPANVLWIEVFAIGGAGGGGGGGTSALAGGDGGAGGTSAFDSNTAVGGSPGTGGGVAIGAGGLGGTGGSGAVIDRISGGDGAYGLFYSAASGAAIGGVGGSGYYGGAGGSLGNAAKTNSGGGGGGGGSATTSSLGGGGGGAGEYIHFIIKNPSATYTYTVGAGGLAGASGFGGAGGVGAAGRITVIEHYGS